jgi:beta-lactam-binding protein with PASTA domain
MIKKKQLKYFLWITPFFSFLIGYFFLYSFIRKKEIITPRFIGRKVQEGLLVASKCGLNVRVLREQEDVDLPAGIVIEQIPSPGQKIRPNQHIFVSVSKKPKIPKAPDVVGLKVSDITKQLSKLGVQHSSFFLSLPYPKETCIAQAPCVGSLLTKRKLTTYISEGTTKLFIVPDLCGCDFDEVKEFLENEKVAVDVFYAGKTKNKKNFANIVSDQKPMPGSIVDLNKPLFMQIQVR